MISLIIPSYNRLTLLKVTLDNVFAQSKVPDEIIVVDDHSTDGTWEFLNSEMKDKLIPLRTNGKGPGAARNTGLKVVTGTAIQFFDSDDLLTLNKIEDQYTTLKASNSGMVYGPYIPAKQINDTWMPADVIMQYHPIPENISFECLTLRGWNIITQACMFDRNLIKDVGFWRTDLMTHEDKDYIYRISYAIERPTHTNKSAVVYRQHKAQLTDDQTSKEGRIIDMIQAFDSINNKVDWSLKDPITKMRFYGKLFNAYRLLSKEQKKSYNTYNTLQYKLAWYFERVLNKYERNKTKTLWERMHGIVDDKQIFKHFIDLL